MTKLVQEESQNMTDTGNPPPQLPETAGHEPALNVPLIAFLLPVAVVAAFAWMASLERNDQILLIASFGLNPITVRAGGWELLFTYMFLHGSWAGVLVNAAFILVCGASLARAMGRHLMSVVSYLVFFLVCGLAAGLVFCLVHAYDNITVVGASGAMCGLLGAAVRLPVFDDRPGTIKSLVHPRVVAMTASIIIYSAAVAVTHGGPTQPRLEMAWEGHLAGYFVGLLLVEPWLKLFHRNEFTTS